MTDPARVHEFVELLTRNAHRVYSYIRVQLPHENDAEDVFQETSKVLWEKFEQFTPGTNLGAWAMTIANFEVLRFRRQASRQPLNFSEDLLDQLRSSAVAELEAVDDSLTALADCYQKLSPPDRKLIDARYAPEATTKKVAQRMKRSVDSIYRSLRRIHQTLFDCVLKTQSRDQQS